MVMAAEDASKNMIDLASRIASSMFSKNIPKLRSIVHLIPNPPSKLYRSIDHQAFYARQFALPKYSQFSSRYDPMAIFWERRASKIREHVQGLTLPPKEYPLMFTQRPLEDSTMTLLRSFTIDKTFVRIFDHLIRDKLHYPVPSELDLEQLNMAKTLLSVTANLLKGIVEKDLALQLNVLSTIVDIACSMRFLLQLDYEIRKQTL